MSNYLTSIVARTLGTAPLIQPRLRGRFDSMTANDGSIYSPQLDSPACPPWQSESPVEKILESIRYDAPVRKNHRVIGAPVVDAVRPSTRDTAVTDDWPIEGAATTTPTLSVVNSPTEPELLLKHEPVEERTDIALSSNKQPSDDSEVPKASIARSEINKLRLRDNKPLTARTSLARETTQSVQKKSRQDELLPIVPESGELKSPAEANPAWPGNVSAKWVVESHRRTAGVREQLFREDLSVQHDLDVQAQAASNEEQRSNQSQNREFKTAPVRVQSRSARPIVFAHEALPGKQSRGQAAPTIHVTIGRVEVRAVQQSQPSAKPRASQPSMSLDDYLRRRNQGSP